MAEDYLNKAGEVQPSGTDEENMAQLLEWKREGNLIEEELEIYEDELERQYREGTLTREEYLIKEREAELLEYKLEKAEDALEYTFGIDS